MKTTLRLTTRAMARAFPPWGPSPWWFIFMVSQPTCLRKYLTGTTRTSLHACRYNSPVDDTSFTLFFTSNRKTQVHFTYDNTWWIRGFDPNLHVTSSVTFVIHRHMIWIFNQTERIQIHIISSHLWSSLVLLQCVLCSSVLSALF